jgi:hypothetical protein
VDVVDGTPVGEPSRHSPNIGFARVAVTDRGDIFRTQTVIAADVYLRTIDLSGQRDAGAPSRIVANQVGNHVAPAWSPDGRSIAYFTIRDSEIPGANPLRTLTVQDATSGHARSIPLSLAFLAGYSPRWAPDGRSLVVYGWDRDDARSGYYQVDVQTGEVTPLVITGVFDVPPLWDYAPDGQRFLYRDPKRGIVAHHFSDGAESLLVARGALAINRFFVAPDGHAIALIRSVRTGDRWTTILEVRQQDGSARELARRTSPLGLDLHGWTADARDLIYSDGGTQSRNFFRVSEAGGTAVDMRFAAAPTPNPVSLSPDGQRVAYTERVVEYEVLITPMTTNSR